MPTDREKPQKTAHPEDPRSTSLSFRALASQAEGEYLLHSESEGASGAQSGAALKESERIALERRRALYDEALVYLESVFNAVGADDEFDLGAGFRLMERITADPPPSDPLLIAAIHAEPIPRFVIQHSLNVAIYAVKIAVTLGMGPQAQVDVGMLGLLHDIGTVRIPDSITYKPDRLTSGELGILRERPNHSYDILLRAAPKPPYLAEYARQVYERIDGSGYPRGVAEDELHEYAQIVGVVDVYEALIHSRPQRDKYSHFNAIKEIIHSGKGRFENRYLKALINGFSIFPLGSCVRLNSGAIGRVIQTYPDQPLRPRIRILRDSQGNRVLTERIINLPDDSLLCIVDSVDDQEIAGPGEAGYPSRGAGIESAGGRQ